MNFRWPVLICIDADFLQSELLGKHSPRSARSNHSANSTVQQELLLFLSVSVPTYFDLSSKTVLFADVCIMFASDHYRKCMPFYDIKNILGSAAITITRTLIITVTTDVFA